MRLPRILYIDDDAEIRDNVAELLAAEGFEPTVAATGEEGLRRARETPPDLILCDVMLSGMNGYEVIRAVGESHSTESIPFIFLSARADRADIRLGLDLGADAYVTKPFGRAELIATIRARLGRPRSIAG
jgi:DNA-binding response OmpR family regulator